MNGKSMALAAAMSLAIVATATAAGAATSTNGMAPGGVMVPNSGHGMGATTGAGAPIRCHRMMRPGASARRKCPRNLHSAKHRAGTAGCGTAAARRKTVR